MHRSFVELNERVLFPPPRHLHDSKQSGTRSLSVPGTVRAGTATVAAFVGILPAISSTVLAQPQSFEQCLVCERYNGAAVRLCVFLAELSPAGRTLSREQNSVFHSASRLSSLDSSSDAILSFPRIWAAASHTSSATHYCQIAIVMPLQDWEWLYMPIWYIHAAASVYSGYLPSSP